MYVYNIYIYTHSHIYNIIPYLNLTQKLPVNY